MLGGEAAAAKEKSGPWAGNRIARRRPRDSLFGSGSDAVY
jgi:hypothetical protein